MTRKKVGIIQVLDFGNGLDNFKNINYSYINPFTLRAAKTGLTILIIFSEQKHFGENISWRNVCQKPNNNSSTNIL